jgi:hypothetical protein
VYNRADCSIHTTGELTMNKKQCPKCKETKLETKDYWYFRSDRNGRTQSYCKACNHQNVLDRQRKFKQKLVDVKGGECVKCGYKKSNAALQFHHLNPAEKDFNFAKYRLTSFEKNKEEILAELDKCILVCANCHSEIHYGI